MPPLGLDSLKGHRKLLACAERGRGVAKTRFGLVGRGARRRVHGEGCGRELRAARRWAAGAAPLRAARGLLQDGEATVGTRAPAGFPAPARAKLRSGARRALHAHLLEGGAGGVDLVHQVLHADDAVAAQGALHNRVVGQRDAALVDLAEAALEDQLLLRRNEWTARSHKQSVETVHGASRQRGTRRPPWRSCALPLCTEVMHTRSPCLPAARGTSPEAVTRLPGSCQSHLDGLEVGVAVRHVRLHPLQHAHGRLVHLLRPRGGQRGGNSWNGSSWCTERGNEPPRSAAQPQPPAACRRPAPRGLPRLAPPPPLPLPPASTRCGPPVGARHALLGSTTPVLIRRRQAPAKPHTHACRLPGRWQRKKDHTKAEPGPATDLEEHAGVDLAQAQQLQDLLRLGGHVVDTADADLRRQDGGSAQGRLGAGSG